MGINPSSKPKILITCLKIAFQQLLITLLGNLFCKYEAQIAVLTIPGANSTQNGACRWLE